MGTKYYATGRCAGTVLASGTVDVAADIRDERRASQPELAKPMFDLKTFEKVKRSGTSKTSFWLKSSVRFLV